MYRILAIALAAIVLARSGSSPPTQPDAPGPATTEPADSTTGDKLDGDFADVLDGADLTEEEREAFALAHIDVVSPDRADLADPYDPLAQDVAQVCEQSRAKPFSPAPPHLRQEHRPRWQRVCDWARPRWQRACDWARPRWQRACDWARPRWQVTYAWWCRHWRTVVDLVCEQLATQRARPPGRRSHRGHHTAYPDGRPPGLRRRGICGHKRRHQPLTGQVPSACPAPWHSVSARVTTPLSSRFVVPR